jgi:hypothetical protein
MYRPGPRKTNQYDPTRMTKNMAMARANSKYSVSKVAPTDSVRKRMTAKIAKDIAPVITTVLSIVGLIIAAYSSPGRQSPRR